MKKRRASYKGRLLSSLFAPGVEQEEASLAINLGKPIRPKSRTINRAPQTKKFQKEKNIKWDNGYIEPGRTQETFLNQTAKTESLDNTRDDFMNTKGGKDLQAQLNGGNPMLAAVGGGGGQVIQKVEMTKEQKRQFIQEIKTEMREMINSIAAHHTSQESIKINYRIDRMEKHHKCENRDMIDKFEKEMLIVSEYCKK